MTDLIKVRHIRRDEASKYLKETWGISRTPKTLAKLAVTGGGPAYQKDGRFPLYTIASLDAWVKSHLSPSVTSSAELTKLVAGRST